jgi:hypothetical protein
MWCRANAGTGVNALDVWWRGHRVSAIISMTSNGSGVLIRGRLVGKVPPEPYAEASTLRLP